MLSPRIGLKSLAGLCRRLAISLDAGLDMRRVWQREADMAHGRHAPQIAHIRDAVAGGDNLAEALNRTGQTFPPLVREMVQVGEHTGMASEIFRRLADYYEFRLQMRRAFVSQITWPMIQLGMALGVVGLLIWIMGMLPNRSGGKPIDLLGFGLVGDQGLMIYMALVLAGAAAVTGLVIAVQRGALWTRPLQHALLRIPSLGRCLETLALARMAFTLELTLNVDMPLQKVLPLSLRATGNDFYIQCSDQIVADIMAGQEIHQALRRSGAFPAEMIEVVEIGETSGKLVESMGRLSRQYEEHSRAALNTLSVIAGFVIWSVVAAFIIFLIFRIAGFYLGTINEALEGF